MTDKTAAHRSLDMRFSFSVLLLGWWMVKQKWMSSGQSYPKPSISVRPGTTVTLGENATISCKSVYKAPIFFLYKQTYILRVAQASNYMVVFPIANFKQSNEGSYSCIYCFRSYECSPFSAGRKIQLAAQVYPKPFISVGPSGSLAVGGSANILCNAENNTQADFYLYKQGASLLQNTVKSSKGVFHFTNAQQSDGGIYWCTYCIDSITVYHCSNFSDNIHINITDPNLRTPSISVRPRRHLVLDSDVIIECEGPQNGLNFSLHKASHLVASQMSEPSRNVTQFALSMKRLEDAGNYTCRYHHRENPFVWSEPSNPVELTVTERSMTTIWAGCAAGLLLGVLLLLLAFILYRKGRKGPQSSERSQVINTPLGTDAKAVYDEISYGADLDEVTYAALNQDSLKMKTRTVSDSPESCVYASVAVDRNSKGH